MDWNDLRLLATLMAEGNLKATARALELDYSTVWRHVQRLEAALGGRLFVRMRGRVQPTALGRQLGERAREIERLLVAAQAMGAESAELAGELRVGTADMLLGPLVLPTLRRLRQDAPGLRLSLAVAPDLRSVARLEIDAAIRLGAPVSDDVVDLPLGQLGYGAYATPELASQCRGQKIAQWPMLMLHERWHRFTTMQWLFRQVAMPRGVGEFDTMMSMVEAAEAGLGVGLLPHAVAVRSGRLSELPLESPIESSRLALVYHPGMRKDARIRALASAVSAEAKERRHLLLGGSSAPRR